MEHKVYVTFDVPDCYSLTEVRSYISDRLDEIAEGIEAEITDEEWK